MKLEPYNVEDGLMGLCPKCGIPFERVDIKVTPVMSPYNNATITLDQSTDESHLMQKINVRLTYFKFDNCNCRIFF